MFTRLSFRFGAGAFALLLTTIHVVGVSGQAVVVGDVVDRATAEPLVGVFVAVVDSAGHQVGGVLTNEVGRFRARVAVPGTYILRAGRIGFDPVDSPPIELGSTPVNYRFELESRPIELAGVVVEAEERQCRVRPEEGGRLQTIWEQVRIALDVAAWTERTGYVRAQQLTYERWMYPVSGRVREEAVQGRRTYGRAGFVAAAPEQLVTEGFIREVDGDYVFHGLDATTIASDPFLDTHCFRLQGPRRGQEGLIGLAFEPMQGRTVPGVRGVLWLHEETAELRSLEYVYTWLPWRIPADPYGGEAEFRRLPGGAWIVERWAIRMPEFEEVPSRLERSSIPGGERRTRIPASERLLIKEEGGEVTAIYTSDGIRLPGAERAALQGVVHDSITGGPLTGARVRIEGTVHGATTDERGRYRMDDLPAGIYVVTFEHPGLEEWDVTPAIAEVSLERGTVTVQDLAAPSLATVLAMGCPEDAAGAEGSAVVVGRVVAEGMGEPVGGALVSLRLPGQGREEGLETWTDASGVYRFCDVPARGTVLVTAAFLGRAGPEDMFEVPTTSPAFHEVTLEMDAPSRVVGRVVDVETGQPLSGVTVRIGGADAGRVSGDDGRFLFPAVGPGRHTLEARHLAYHTVEDGLVVDGSGRTLQVEVSLAAGAIPLDPIVVTVESRPMSGTLRAVHDRMDRVRLTGGGTVFDRQDIERRNPRQVTQLLGEVHGVQTGTFSNTPIITSTRAFSGFGVCLMTVWIDGILVIRGGTRGASEELSSGSPPANVNDFIAISNIEAIEVYHAGGRIPGEYWGSDSGCGVVLIWSRRET